MATQCTQVATPSSVRHPASVKIAQRPVAASPRGPDSEAVHRQEFEREPVPEKALKHWSSFLAIFVGRHTAGTEFSIGPLFIVHGATAVDIVVGLFVGNILASLTWRFLCAPIAVRKRLTVSFLLERIVGAKAAALYGLIVGVFFALVAGAMFAVSGTALGVLFDVPMPCLHDWWPSSWAWVSVVAAMGTVTSVVAAFGYRHVSLFSKVVAPYMFAVIVYMAYQSLKKLQVHSFGDFWSIASTKVFTGHVQPGFERYGFFHCVCAAWFCDLLLHAGMNDVSILRYAKTANVGWLTAAGMFAGHYFTWIVAGLLYAVQLDDDPSNNSVAPGPMANAVAGANGIFCVIFAGWTTANPIIYEAGLAFQHAFGPGWQTPTVTLLVGGMPTLAGTSPALVMGILNLLLLGGAVALPFGVVIAVDTFLLPSLGFESEHCEAMKDRGREGVTNWPAVASWALSMAICLPLLLSRALPVHLSPFVCAPVAGLAYILGVSCCDRMSLWPCLEAKPEAGKVHLHSESDARAGTATAERSAAEAV